MNHTSWVPLLIMILTTITLVIVCFKKFPPNDPEDVGGYIILVSIVSFFASLMVTGIISDVVSKCFFKQEWKEEYSIALLNLRDKSSTEGDFYLGTGSIRSNDYYIYYREWNDGGYKKEKLNAYNSSDDCKNNITIHEREGWEKGEIKVFKAVFTEKWNYYISQPEKCPKIQFHIPKGSIRKEFVLE